jgi:hypothetical protein
MSLATDIMKAKAMRDELNRLERHIAEESQRRPVTPADEKAMIEMQARADAVYEELGRRAPPPLPGEQPIEFRRRLLEPLKKYSEWSNTPLDSLSPDVLDRVEPDIFAAARADAASPTDMADGEIREIVKKDDRTGHVVTTFRGPPSSHFVRQFTRPVRRARLRSWEDYTAMSRL